MIQRFFISIFQFQSFDVNFSIRNSFSITLKFPAISIGRSVDATQETRELMRSNSERDRHMTNHHHASTMSHRKAYRDPHDYRDHSTSNGLKGEDLLACVVYSSSN